MAVDLSKTKDWKRRGARNNRATPSALLPAAARSLPRVCAVFRVLAPWSRGRVFTLTFLSFYFSFFCFAVCSKDKEMDGDRRWDADLSQ